MSVVFGQCDARPIVTPSCRASLPFDRYQIILLDNRGTRMNNLPKVVIYFAPDFMVVL